MTRSPVRSRPRSRRISAPGSSTTSPRPRLTLIEKARANDSSAPNLDPVTEGPAPEPYRLLSDVAQATPAARGAVTHLLRGVWIAPTVESAARAFTLGATVAVLRDGTRDHADRAPRRPGRRHHRAGARRASSVGRRRGRRACRGCCGGGGLPMPAIASTISTRRSPSRWTRIEPPGQLKPRPPRWSRAREQTLDAALKQAERAAATLVTRRAEADRALEAQVDAERQLAAAGERHSGLEAAAAATEAQHSPGSRCSRECQGRRRGGGTRALQGQSRRGAYRGAARRRTPGARRCPVAPRGRRDAAARRRG